jgi:ABC-type transport system involved in multi-copper enzyme maturation permease subunit
MKTKELLEARWKVIIFELLALLTSAGNIVFYPSNTMQPSADHDIPSMFQNLVPSHFTNSFNTFVWESWFATNGPFILGLFAAILGGGLIANEVSKGTIFFLLSKPVSRERILLIKYGVSAGLLLAVSAMSSIALAIMSIVLGYPQDLLHLLIATVLLWLAALFPLGLALFFSIVSPDSLRPVVFSLLITITLVLLPAILPNGLNWSLWHYWNNLDAYLTGSFPLKEYLVCLVTALVPLLAALIVFRRKAY